MNAQDENELIESNLSNEIYTAMKDSINAVIKLNKNKIDKSKLDLSKIIMTSLVMLIIDFLSSFSSTQNKPYKLTLENFIKVLNSQLEFGENLSKN